MRTKILVGSILCLLTTAVAQTPLSSRVELTTPATNDYFWVLDASAGAGAPLKRISYQNLYSIPAGFVVDFGVGGSFELPNSAAPTVDAFGELAGDNDRWAASRGAILTWDGTAVTALIGVLNSDVPTNLQVPKFNTATGTITWENDNDTGGATAFDAIGDPVGNGVIAFAGTQQDFTSTLDSGILWEFTNTDLDAALDTTFIKLLHNDGADDNVIYLWAVGDADGTPVDVFKLSQTALTINVTTTVPTLVPTNMEFEGATADAFETVLEVVDPTADRTVRLPNATTTLVGQDTTDTLTNKTFDSAGTGNVLKAKAYIYLVHPHLVEGTNATLGTTSTSIAYGHATFSNSVDQATNYVEYYFQVPEDLDTAVDLRARIKVLLGGADTGSQRYVLSSVSVADSAVPTASTLANAINVDFAGDGTGANGDVETSAWTTLTGWRSALTAGQTWRIRFARDGNDVADGSTVNSTELGLVIEYGLTQ